MDEKAKKGTTTVGIVAKDGVVLAADKRATMGTLIASKDVEKIAQIDKHLAMTVAGSVGDAQKLVRLMRVQALAYKHEKEEPISVKAAATLLANILSASKFFPYWVQLLLAGYDEKPRLYNIDLLGGYTEESYTATGSGSPIAYGVLESHIKGVKGVKDAVPVAIKAVWAAMQRDAASGEGIDVVVITKEGVKRLSADEVKKHLR